MQHPIVCPHIDSCWSILLVNFEGFVTRVKVLGKWRFNIHRLRAHDIAQSCIASPVEFVNVARLKVFLTALPTQIVHQIRPFGSSPLIHRATATIRHCQILTQ